MQIQLELRRLSNSQYISQSSVEYIDRNSKIQVVYCYVSVEFAEYYDLMKMKQSAVNIWLTDCIVSIDNVEEGLTCMSSKWNQWLFFSPMLTTA